MKSIFMIITIIIMFITPLESVFAQVSDSDEYFTQNSKRNELGNELSFEEIEEVEDNRIIPFYWGESVVDFTWGVAKYIASLSVDILERTRDYFLNRLEDLFFIVKAVITGEFKEAFLLALEAFVDLQCGVLDVIGLEVVQTLTYMNIVTIDTQTKSYLKRYKTLYGDVDLDDVVVHNYNPFHDDGTTITLYNHIYFEDEARIPRAFTYSLSPTYNQEDAVNWFKRNKSSIDDRFFKNSLGEVVIRINGYTERLKNINYNNVFIPSNLNSLSNEDKENIKVLLDVLYENNITTLLHELVHVAQFTIEYSSEGEFICDYLVEVAKYGYEKSPKEQKAYKANALFFSDFSKKIAESVDIPHKTADQDGVISCIPVNFETETYCNNDDVCDNYARNLISCNMWDNCTFQFLYGIGLNPWDTTLNNEDLENLSEKDIEKLLSNCYSMDNCPSKYNPEQEASEINFIGSECYEDAKENFCIDYENKTIIMPARDVDGDCRINGLRNERFSKVGDINITYDKGVSYLKEAVREIKNLKLKQSGDKSWETMYCLLDENYGKSVYLGTSKRKRLKAGFAFYSMMLDYDNGYMSTPILSGFNCKVGEYNDWEILHMINSRDNCFNKKNYQSDLDGDGFGDTCDYDIDGDGDDNKYEVRESKSPFSFYDRYTTDKDLDGIFDFQSNQLINTEKCLDMCKEAFLSLENHNQSFYNSYKFQYFDWVSSSDWRGVNNIEAYVKEFKKNTNNLNYNYFCEYTCNNNYDNCSADTNIMETTYISPMFTSEIDENGIGGALNMNQTKTSAMQYYNEIIWQADHDLDGKGDVCDDFWKYITYSVDKAFYVDVVIPDTTYEEKVGPVTVKHYDVKHDSYKIFLLSLIGAETDKNIIDASMYFCYCETGNCETDCSKDYNHATDTNFSRWHRMTPANIDDNTLGIVEYEIDDSDYRGDNESVYSWDWRKDLESWYLSNKNIVKTIEFCETDNCPKYKFVVSTGVNVKGQNYTKEINNEIKRNPNYFYNDWRQLEKEGKEFSTAKFANAVRSEEFSVSYEKKHVIKTVKVESYTEINTDIEIKDGIIVGGEVITEDKIIQNPTETKIIKPGVNLSQPTVAKPIIKF